LCKGSGQNKANGENGYRSIRHRNSIETWTASPLVLANNSTSYNFITATTKAYGSLCRHGED
jgi:predicted Zn-dependent protease